MNLSEENFLFLDCQTTGMRPPKGHLLEIAWGIGSAAEGQLLFQKSFIIELPESHIPGPIQKITGLTDSDLIHAVSDKIVFQELSELPQKHNVTTAIIHYSQFEKAFFTDLFFRHQNNPALPFEILCSAQISKKLFPALPSANIRAVAGYLGASTDSLKRSAAHVAATYHIWKSMAPNLETQGVKSLVSLKTWLSEKQSAPQAKVPYEYRVEKLTRLSFPNSPGIYRMRNKNDDVLYVGKAKSLRSRVNSYFRGQKGRDRKKLEMLSQVWNIEYVECPTALEAALLETDEIKLHNPPYNIYLKENRHESIFFDKQFLTSTEKQDELHRVGPLRPNGAIETLRLLFQGLLLNEVPQIFYSEIPQNILELGFLKFCLDMNVDSSSINWVRDGLVLGLRRIRHTQKQDLIPLEDENESNNESNDPPILTVTTVAEKFSRLFERAGREYLRARKLTRLLNSTVYWLDDANNSYSLCICNGQIRADGKTSLTDTNPWKNLKLSDYDRMSILLSELQKHEYRIAYRC